MKACREALLPGYCFREAWGNDRAVRRRKSDRFGKLSKKAGMRAAGAEIVKHHFERTCTEHGRLIHYHSEARMKPSVFASFLRSNRSGGRRSADECVRLCAEAGFEEIDYSPDFADDGWAEESASAAEAASKYGVRISQSHAPYNFYKKDDVERFIQLLDRAAEGARILGVNNLVFHFDEYHPSAGERFDSAKALKRAYEVLSPAIEKTVSFGINAALENTFEDHHRVGPDERSHLCAEIEELEAALDLFSDPRVTCCWDFGHAHLQFGPQHTEMLERMGKRISCTHVHDNYYGKDLHLLPFYGQLDWETLIPTLAKCGYNGSLAFEAGYGRFPDELMPDFMSISKHAMDILCAYAGQTETHQNRMAE